MAAATIIIALWWPLRPTGCIGFSPPLSGNQRCHCLSNEFNLLASALPTMAGRTTLASNFRLIQVIERTQNQYNQHDSTAHPHRSISSQLKVSQVVMQTNVAIFKRKRQRFRKMRSSPVCSSVKAAFYFRGSVNNRDGKRATNDRHSHNALLPIKIGVLTCYG